MQDIIVGTDNIKRCGWCGNDALYQNYHDTEWGNPSFDDRHLFEMLNLEGAQAGLSWITVLRKREHYKHVFDNFDPIKIASYGQHKVEQLLQDSGIIRNRLKINATITNAQAYLKLINEFDCFSDYLWQFVDGTPIVNQWQALADNPATTHISDTLSKDLKKRGFKFIGSTICYAFMQATGMVNDHLVDCAYHNLSALCIHKV